MLVDSNNLAMRAIHAMSGSNLTNSEGIDTGPLNTFISMVGKYIRWIHPDYVVFCWDGGQSSFRKSIFPEYKGSRGVKNPDSEDSFALMKHFLQLAGFNQIERKDVEADDIIASIWRTQKKLEINIVSGDKDFYQLINDHTKVWHPGEDEPWDKKRFEEHYGFAPQDMLKVMALTGDKVDGIPGIPKVAIKTAVKLLSERGWSLERVIADSPIGRIDIDPVVVRRNLALIDLVQDNIETGYFYIGEFNPTKEDGSAAWKYLMQFVDKYELANIKAKLILGRMWF